MKSTTLMRVFATWIKISSALLLAVAPRPALAGAAHGDGTLNLYDDRRKESLDIRFRDAQGRPIPAALEKIGLFLRSPDNKTHEIDLQLIDLVDAIQDHFHEPVIEIISGYRSPEYNHTLREAGHAVALESLHMQGFAVDIHLDTVTEEAVRDYAQSLKRGGVGWYPQNDFVHVDIGEIHTWGHPEGTRKWVGLDNNTGSLFIRTDSNRYFRGNDIRVDVSPASATYPWAPEHFERGQWKPVPAIGDQKLGSKLPSFIPRNQNKTGPKGAEFSRDKSLSGTHFRIPHATTDSLARGRYRLRIADSVSNEFYLKN